MKTVKQINKNFLEVKFSNMEKSEFFNLLDKIKQINERRFDAKNKSWIIAKTDNNINYLKSLGFELNELKENYNLVNIIVYNNIIVIDCDYNLVHKLIEHFTFEDHSYCFINGIYDANRIKKRTMTKLKDDKVYLPIGFKTDLLSFLKENNINYKLEDTRKHLLRRTYSTIEIENNLHYLKLYNYQIKAIRACLCAYNCIIKLATASGKCCSGDTIIEIEYDDEEIEL